MESSKYKDTLVDNQDPSETSSFIKIENSSSDDFSQIKAEEVIINDTRKSALVDNSMQSANDDMDVININTCNRSFHS